MGQTDAAAGFSAYGVDSITADLSEGIEQVNRAVTQMDQMTQQNAALVEQAAAAAKSMEHFTQDLSAQMEVFELGESSAQVASVTRMAPPPTALLEAQHG